MDFLDKLQEFLYHLGFRKGKNEDDSQILWLKDCENSLAMIQIIPELLPGQTRKPLEEQEEEIRKIENQLMVRLQKKVDRLTLMIFKDMPETEMIKELSKYPDIWCLDRRNARVLLFERQKTDFYGLRDALDQFVCNYQKKERIENRKELKEIFQPVNTIIVAVNIIIFMLLSFFGNVEDAVFMEQHGALAWSDVVEYKEYYRLFTSMFLHFGLDHLLQNMLILILVGCRLENVLGKGKYIAVYFASGIAAAVTSLFVTLSGNPYTVSAGASGAIFGVIGGLLAIIIKDVIQKKSHRVKEIGLTGILFMIGGAVSYGFFETGVDNAAHLGGLAAGLILTAILG